MNEQDLKQRTKHFALRIIKLVNVLPSTITGRAIGGQLIRCGTSVGANYRAVCRARSEADFIAKLGIVEEEADESAFWLEIIIESGLIKEDLIKPLLQEANEIIAIIVASRKSLNQKSKIKNQKSQEGTALFMTLLILTGILTVTLGAASLVAQGILMSRTQEQSTKAYFAAEAGAERALWEVRKNSYAPPTPPADNIFGDVYLGNGSLYQVDYATSSSLSIFTSSGIYRGTKRSVQIGFVGLGVGVCEPDCDGKACGDDDGCGNACPATCYTLLGCRDSAPLNASLTAGECCGISRCYKCNSGFTWDGESCATEEQYPPCVFDLIFNCLL